MKELPIVYIGRRNIIMEKFKPSEYPQVKELFRKHFDVSPEIFLDKEYTAMFGRIHIDIIKFDTWLHERFGAYEESRCTMKDLINKEFGAEGVDLLNSVT